MSDGADVDIGGGHVIGQLFFCVSMPRIAEGLQNTASGAAVSEANVQPDLDMCGVTGLAARVLTAREESALVLGL